MDKIKDLAQALVDSTAAKEKNKTSAYDTSAEVISVEGSTAWIRVPGGVDRTPARMVVDAKPGDEVYARITGGKAYITGNVTAPPTDDTYAKRAEAQAIRATRAADAAAESAGVAQKSADSAILDAQRANKSAESAIEDAATAKEAADSASADAADAKSAATQAISDAADAADAASAAAQAAATADAKATAAGTAAQAAQTSANNAQTSANEAKASATNASEYAARALGNLSTVQNVAETLNWITAHGTMTLTTDQALDPTHVYFVVDASGDYVVGGAHYSVVSEPDVADIATYYELSIDESLNNYVATHLAVDSEGLWIIPDAGGNKVLISTGQGTAYPSAGTFVIGKVGGVDTVLAKFTADGASVGDNRRAHSTIDADGQRFYASDGTTQLANIGYGEGQTASGSNYSPYYVFGLSEDVEIFDLNTATRLVLGWTYRYDNELYVSTRNSSSVPIPPDSDLIKIRSTKRGALSFAEGAHVRALGYASHAEGGTDFFKEGVPEEITHAIEAFSHAEGRGSIAAGKASHAEGQSTATGNFSHAEGSGSRATGSSSHAEGTSKASGEVSHAEGRSTALGNGSHAEGYLTTAEGEYSHTEGRYCRATGAYSHAQNNNTSTKYDYQTAIGKYNDNKSDSAFEIGNGTSTLARSNAFRVDWDGNVEAAGDYILDIDDSAASGDDFELKQALINAGIWNDVIVT